jgi:hypothetical protein
MIAGHAHRSLRRLALAELLMPHAACARGAGEVHLQAVV